jgi:Bacterial Ig-like domain (group 2)
MRKPVLVIALLLSAACKGTDGPEQKVTTTVVVSSAPNQITVNETAQASAIVKDQNGDPLSGKSITWRSLNQGIATVSSAGLIRGVAPGVATIQGSVDGVNGEATISVVAPVPSCTSGPTSVDIGPGEVRVLGSSETQGCIKINSTAAASQYIVIGASTNALPDVLSSYGLKSDEGETVPTNTAQVNPLRFAVQAPVSEADLPGAVQSRFESQLRRMERRDLNLRGAQRAYAARAVDSDLRMSVSVAIPGIGDKTTFKVPAKFDASGKHTGGGCNAFTSVTATVKHISGRSIIYTDDAAPAGGFSDTEFQEIGTEFDSLIYPTDVNYFGTPLDLDKNSRIILLYTPLVNKLTEPNSNGFVGGFFFSGDLFPTTGPPDQSCAQSNVAELFYLLAPDPDGTINSNRRSTETVRQGTRGTIAHEFQHMINASERIKSPVADAFEATWLDESLAHYAEDLNGRVLKGLTETGNYSFATLFANKDDYDAFFFQNFARFKAYLQNPGPNAPTSEFSDTSLADRGAGWALLRYTADQYAPGGDIKGFIKSLVAGPDTGVANLRNHAGNVPFDTLVAAWMVANYADDAGISGLSSRYGYKTYDMRDNVRKIVSSNPANQIYPLKITTVTGTGFVVNNLQVRSASGNYFSFARPPAGPARSFRFLNTDLGNAASFTGATLIILRTQ